MKRRKDIKSMVTFVHGFMEICINLSFFFHLKKETINAENLRFTLPFQSFAMVSSHPALNFMIKSSKKVTFLSPSH